jgi:hypothetical protein
MAVQASCRVFEGWDECVAGRGVGDGSLVVFLNVGKGCVWRVCRDGGTWARMGGDGSGEGWDGMGWDVGRGRWLYLEGRGVALLLVMV